MNLKDKIEAYEPFNLQEEKDKLHFLKFINTFDDVLTRENEFGHFTSSAFVVNKQRTKMVVVYHNILKGWIYPGGHADGCEDLLKVAIKEVEEETNLKAKVIDNNIFAINANAAESHIRRGEFVPSHIHFDVVYLLEANEFDKLNYREEESKGVKWINLEDAYDDSMVGFIRPVHKKLVKKLRQTKY